MLRRRDYDGDVQMLLGRIAGATSLAMGRPLAISQQSWFVDPSNTSLLASPNNSGLTATSPLDRFSTLFNRWGTRAPVFTGAVTTVTLMSNGILDGSDPVDLRPICADGGGFILDGTLRQVAAGNFAVVTAQNRATAQRYQATVTGQAASYWSAYVGLLVHDVTANSWFWVMRDLGAQTATLTRPKTSSLTAATSSLSTTASGNAYVIYDLPKLDLVRYSPDSLNFANVSFTQTYPCQIQHISTDTSTIYAQPGTTHYDGSCVLAECRMTSREPALFNGSLLAGNCFSGGPVMYQGAGIYAALSGCLSANDEWCVAQGGTVLLDGDAYCDDHVHASNAQVIVGLAFFHHRDDVPAGRFKIPTGQGGDGAAGAGASLIIAPQFYGSASFWGTASLECSAGGDVVYQGTAVAVIQNTGGLLLDGVATASSYDGVATWAGGIALTPANLDAAAGAAGFGGCAYGVKGSKIHQWV